MTDIFEFHSEDEVRSTTGLARDRLMTPIDKDITADSTAVIEQNHL